MTEENELIVNQAGAEIQRSILLWENGAKDQRGNPPMEWYIAERLARFGFIRTSKEIKRAECRG